MRRCQQPLFGPYPLLEPNELRPLVSGYCVQSRVGRAQISGQCSDYLEDVGQLLRPVSRPLTLGQHLVSVLDTCARVATYKLAALVALLEFAVENVSDDHDSAVDVDLDDLAKRVVRLHWRHVPDFDVTISATSCRPKRRFPTLSVSLLERRQQPAEKRPLDIASRKTPDLFREMIERVKLVLVTQPLYRPQRVPGG